MKILMVLDSYFPPDSRVEKEAISLSEAGNEVHIICYAKKDQPLVEKALNYTIHRFKVNNFIKNKLSATALILPFFFHIWKQQIKIIQKKEFFEAIHIHDLPLSKVGYYFKKKFECKLICDQHEFYSDWISQTAHMNTFIGKIVMLLSNWVKYEKKYLKAADLVITVSKSLEQNYRNKYKLNNIITVPNTPSKKIYNNSNIDISIINQYKNDFVIFYAGNIDILRGIDTAIKALNQLIKDIPNIKLVLCGKIVNPYNPFKTAKDYKVLDHLIFKGWIQENKLPSYIAASNICFFVPPANRDEINKTIPTKIFQYAVMKKPIIVSEAHLMKNFVEKNKIGISIPSNDSNAFYKAVLNIYKNIISINNYKIKTNWYWENTIYPLINKYQF